MKRILYVRSAPYEVNINAYNLQEIGLAEAFYNYGYQCDVLYYNKKKSFDQIINKNGVNIKILWRHGLRLLRTGIYPQILKKQFLQQYDYIICSEYSQLMSVLISKKFNNTYIYNGPYYNLFKIPFMESIYDKLFCKYINKTVRKVFCKTNMAKDYISKKGITNSVVTGVGLDVEKFMSDIEIEPDTDNLLKRMEGHKNFLYIGSISKRKNVELIIKAFIKFKENEETENFQLVIVGSGDKKYTQYCHSLIPDKLKQEVLWCNFIKNSQTKFIYKAATVFLLPSIQEIFGMVMLESMYFGLPVIASMTAGSSTLIKDSKNGIIVKDFDEDSWIIAMMKFVKNPKLSEELGDLAGKTIHNNFMWDSIVHKMLENMESVKLI